MAVQRDTGDRPAGPVPADSPAGSAADPVPVSSSSADSALAGPASASLARPGSCGADDASGRSLAAPRAGTGEPRVDAALGRLDELDNRPISEHPAVFEHVHARLSEVLGELDSGAAGHPGQDS